jgi:hypothetical protein
MNLATSLRHTHTASTIALKIAATTVCIVIAWWVILHINSFGLCH